jgi:hypothetical protein
MCLEDVSLAMRGSGVLIQIGGPWMCVAKLDASLLKVSFRRWDTSLLRVPFGNYNAAGSLDGERALFIVAAAVYLYLRPSDLATANEAFPTMDAFRLEHGNWWLVLDARNPPLRIPVGQDFLQYLVRYRVSRGLSPLPEINEQVPLLETVHGRSGLGARRIKEIVKTALAEIHRKLKCDGHSDAELELLKTVSLRWFRDSGAKLDARVRAPADLQKSLGNVSLSYVYGRYYAE